MFSRKLSRWSKPLLVVFASVAIANCGGGSGGTPTQNPAAPVVTGDAVFSEASRDSVVAYSMINTADWGGNAVNNDESSAAVTPLEGGVVLASEFVSPATQAWGGTVFDFTSVDVSAKTDLKFGIDTSAMTGFQDMQVKLEDAGATGVVVYLSDYTPTTSGAWSVYSIPLSDFASVDLATLKFLGFWNPSNKGTGSGNVPGAASELSTGTLYLDDVYFDGTAAPVTAPVASTGDAVYSDTTRDNSLSSSMINTADWGGNAVNNNQVSTAVTPVEGTYVLASEFVSPASQAWGGVVFDFTSVDVSANTELKFSIDSSAMTGFQDMQVKLEDAAANGDVVYLSSYTPVVSGNWSAYTIPLSDFPAGISRTTLKFLGFWNPSNAGTGVGGVPSTAAQLSTGTLYMDDVYFD